MSLTVNHPNVTEIEKLHNCQRKQGNLQRSENGKWCCYVNYKRVYKIDVEIATTLMARDYKGFGGSTEYSNGVIELWEST